MRARGREGQNGKVWRRVFRGCGSWPSADALGYRSNTLELLTCEGNQSSAVPAGLGGMFNVLPKAEALGYSRLSLRDSQEAIKLWDNQEIQGAVWVDKGTRLRDD